MPGPDYIQLRNSYIPQVCRVIFVCESPPASGRYFYDPNGSVSEPLFRALMKDVLKFLPASKGDGLKEFAERGFFLLDATYSPVNHLSRSERAATILRDFPILLKSLREYATSETLIILVKTNVCDLLELRIKNAGLSVGNNGLRIPFPSSGRQSEFRTAIQKVFFPQA